MSELLKRLGWLTSLALCTALIGAGCNSEPGDMDDDGTNEVTEEVSASPPSIPSTDMGEVPPASGEMGTMPGGNTGGEPAPAGDPATPAGTGTGAAAGTESTIAPAEPTIEPAPAEPGTEQPAGDDTNN